MNILSFIICQFCLSSFSSQGIYVVICLLHSMIMLFFSALVNEKELTNSSTSLDLTNCGSSMDLTNGSTSLDQELSNHLPHIHPKLTKPPKTEHYSLQEINHWQFSLRESYRLFCPFFG